MHLLVFSTISKIQCIQLPRGHQRDRGIFSSNSRWLEENTVYLSVCDCSSQPTRISSTMSTNYLPVSVTFKAVTNYGFLNHVIYQKHAFDFILHYKTLSDIFVHNYKTYFNSLRKRTGDPQRWFIRNLMWKLIISTMTCLHNQLHNSFWTKRKRLSLTFKIALLPETFGIYKEDRMRDEIPVPLILQSPFSTQTQLRNPRLVIKGLSSVDYTLLYIHVIHKYMQKIRYGDTSRFNLQRT